MLNTKLRTACTCLLWTQVGLTVAAVGLAAVAVLAGAADSGATVVVGAAVSSSLLIYGVVLLAGAGLGLVAVRRGSRGAGLRAGLVLVAPVVLVIGSIPSELSEAEEIPDGVVPDAVLRSLDQMLTLLNWAHGLALGAVVLAAASGILILSSSRSPSAP